LIRLKARTGGDRHAWEVSERNRDAAVQPRPVRGRVPPLQPGGLAGTVVACSLAGLALASLLRPGPGADRFALGLLAGMWIWTGILYYAVFFSAINGASIAFALTFALQGGLFAWAALRPHAFAFTIRKAGASVFGLAFILYAMLVYPLVGARAGQTCQGIPVFGVAPSAVVIFTFRLLLLASRRIPVVLLVIPGLWSLIGGSTAFLLPVPQDWLQVSAGTAPA
jgi:hypothetical protein